MLLQILNALQTILLPLLIGGLLVGGCVVYLVGRPRKPRQPAATPSAQPTIAPRASPPAAPPPSPVVETSDFGPDTEAPPPRPVAAPAAPLTADLLLVDDSAVVRTKLRRLFEPAGYRVAQARDGEEALQLIEQGRYALLITDLEMPKLDGVALIGAVQSRAATADLPILAITGHDDLQARLDECREICGIYRKPWIDEDLLGHVQMLTGSRSGGTTGADPMSG
jgi:CheY-like chemotaxis protein